MRRRSHRMAVARCAAVLALWMAVGAASAQAQTRGTDCGCTATGDYVAPDPGVRTAVDGTGLSPGGRYRVVVTGSAASGMATLDVVRVRDGARILQNVSGLQWGFSPDDERFLISWFLGSAGNQQFEYELYDLGAGVNQRIWRNGPTPWSSERARFSGDGSVFLFAGTEPANGVDVALLDVASRSLYETSFFPSTVPGDVDQDDDPTVAGWGFGPDPTRFVHMHTVNSAQGVTAVTRVDVKTRVEREDTFTSDSLAPFFSPCGDAIALVVKQLALPDLTDVYLYETRNPLAAQLGAQNLPNSALLVQSTLAQHQVLQAGIPNVLAPNHADDACPANVPPDAQFTPPSGPTVGSPTPFTDTSTDSDGQIVGWQWSFGDGTASTTRNPSHAYSAPGTYTVRLTVTDDGGATDFVEHDVFVCGTLGALSGRLLFAETTQLGTELWVVNADDGSRVRLTYQASGSYNDVREGRFSPDATKIAYTDEGTFVAGIWAMNADGSDRHRLTDGSGTTHDFAFHKGPTWSPDGQWIAFVNTDVQTPANQGIWMMRADGTAQAQVPNTRLFDYQPLFAPEIATGCALLAPDQRTPACYTILFGRPEPGSNNLARLWAISGDGQGLSATTPLMSFGDLRLSPDGDTFALSRFLGLVGPIGGVHRIFTRDRSTGGERQITEGGDDNFFDPVWSPTGDAIAYDFSVDGVPGSITNLDVGVTEPTGCDATTLLSGPALAVPLDWATGHAVQGLGSIQGEVRLDTSFLATVPYAVVEMTGDVNATTTADALGHFRFENIPLGANVSLHFVSAPGYIPWPFDVPFEVTGLVGHAVGVDLRASVADAHVTGTIRNVATSAPVDGVTVTATGPGGPIVATTDATGAYAMTLQHYGSYVITPSKPGWRFDPTSFSGQIYTRVLDFQASVLPPPGLIAFVSARTGNDDIWVAASDGSNAHVLIGGPGNQRDPAWSPEGGRIAYATDQGGNGFAIWIRDLSQSFGSPLIGAPARDPAWSPDGSAIVYASSTGLQLYTFADDGTVPLTSDPTDAGPAWRPDGSGLVFERAGTGGAPDLWQLELLPGAQPTPLSQLAGADRDPAFSADGLLAYATQFGSPSGPQYVFTSGRFLTGGANPTWNPDGTLLAYDDGFGSVLVIDLVPSQPKYVSRTSDRDPAWQPPTQCANGVDDDADGAIDLADPDCTDASDTSEAPLPACSNGLDDDGDGRIDLQDPDCTGPTDTTEEYVPPQCSNGIDDDGDGLVDLQDPACSSPTDPAETADSLPCDNGIDDDGDGFVDTRDPGCVAWFDGSEFANTPGCDDGVDNDGDGLVDMADPGCPFPFATYEDPQCDNGWDDDGDGLVDTDDPYCATAWPYWESPPRCGVGAELVVVVAALRRLARRTAALR